MVHLLNMFRKSISRYALQVFILIVLGFAIIGAQQLLTINHFLLSGLAVGLFLVIAYYTVLAYIPATTPCICGTAIALQLAQQALLSLYPLSSIANLSAMIVILSVAWFWYSKLVAVPENTQAQ